MKDLESLSALYAFLSVSQLSAACESGDKCIFLFRVLVIFSANIDIQLASYPSVENLTNTTTILRIGIFLY